uniref:Single-stranded DNA-binding protein n=1 Tax=Roseihalotalea indica TaxID=2867963 RepID=A0AA49JJI6_9BACT|nr:single-stranded DNA-binding protein [Tunicatimonas sp. TK19036]
MNALKNHVQLIGNLGQDPEIKQLESGKTLAKFSLATTESYKNKKGEYVNDTQWHSIIAWDNLAQIAEKYLHKGKQVALVGKLNHRQYEDKEGIKRYVTEIVASDLMMLGKREPATEDELPF